MSAFEEKYREAVSRGGDFSPLVKFMFHEGAFKP